MDLLRLEQLRCKYECYCDEEIEDMLDDLQVEWRRRQNIDMIEYYTDVSTIHKTIVDILSINPEYNDRTIKVHADGKYDVSITWGELRDTLRELLTALNSAIQETMI